jgi:hypothetical protein
VVVTLMHGNEPSGLVAVHGRLRDGRQPATDTFFVLGAVEGALADPYLSSRLLPDGTDLNRCFGRSARSGPCRDLALAILEAVRAAAPEALVDIHNNTGHTPLTASHRRSVTPSAGSPGSQGISSCITTSESARSPRRRTSMFSRMRSGRTDFWTTTTSRWISQRKTTCATDLP